MSKSTYLTSAQLEKMIPVKYTVVSVYICKLLWIRMPAKYQKQDHFFNDRVKRKKVSTQKSILYLDMAEEQCSIV